MLSKACALLMLAAAHVVHAQEPLRVISFNIRYDNHDLAIFDVERGWIGYTCVADPTDCRAPGVAATLVAQTTEAKNASVIGLQEVLKNQLTDIMNVYGADWASLGVGRDDGKSGGEHNPIIYRKDVFEAEYSETKWLSLTPDKPSKSWNSGSNRIVTIAVFKHLATGRRFIHANTHLDNASGEARTNQIGVAVDMIRAVDAKYGPGLPVTLTGDFNAGEGDGAYSALVGEKYVDDVYKVASAAQRTGEAATFTGFSNEFSSRIDYIWIGPQGKNMISVKAYKTVDNLVAKVKISDHRPIVADLVLN